MPRPYAELVCASNFSFLRGASHPDELVLTAKALGLAALAIADRNSLAGVVRAHRAARTAGQRLLVASRLVLRDGTELVVLPRDRAAYGRLSSLLSLGKGRAAKGECDLGLDDLPAYCDGLLAILLPPQAWRPGAPLAALDPLRQAFRRRLWLGAALWHDGRDRARLAALADLAAASRVPLVAAGEVLYHSPQRRRLADVVTCIRAHCTIDAAGFRLAANAERFLKDGDEMARLFAAHPAALEETLAITEQARFSLGELAYDYPVDPLPAGVTVQQQLARLTEEGLLWRYPRGIPPAVRATVDHELALIERLGYAPYFLTVHDLVRFAREQGILAQGRGSAANSAVCYCLGITAVDPARIDLLFERFVSAARDEPPDIDVDFEHERREEVIQYIYGKYGRDRAALAATVITYRSRSALREVAKVMGLSLDAAGALSGAMWSHGQGIDPERVREQGLDPEAPRVALTIALAQELLGFPRHLSQHVGGFVITRQALTEIVPVGWAAMADRSFVEWDKDDLDALGILKIDVLALGMLSCIARCLALLRDHHGREASLASIPEGDQATYDMLSRGDSIGVFQVESRAQMSMLPRLRPQNFYDLVIEVAIVRPGPIQGDMVHPYLRRRQGKERVDYPSPALKAVLHKTLGVPLFQEQAMKIAIVAAGFSAEEADGLRRAMATFRHAGVIHTYRDKMIGGMVERGYAQDFAERCFRQIEGFGTYGFPESHAASFALLVYVSAWLKCHYPAVFAAGLLNSQPMGFYAPAQIVRDACNHGVAMRPVDVAASAWDCTLEADSPGRPALRLGLRQIKGLGAAAAAAILAARAAAPFRDLRDFAERTALDRRSLDLLADADAFHSLGTGRRRALWVLDGLAGAAKAGLAPADSLPLFAAAAAAAPLLPAEPHADLPDMPLGAQVVADYTRLRLSLRAHPVGFLRSDLAAAGSVPCTALARLQPGRRVAVSGLVLIRQRPGSARGTIFITLEDETGIANLIVWPGVFDSFRKAVLGARLLTARGRLQAESGVIHVVAEQLQDDSWRLGQLAGRDGDRLDPGSGDKEDGAYIPRSRDFK